MFGSILKNLRLQKGLSQEKIAEELYVVRQTVSKWENHRSSPGTEQLIRLAAIFDVSIEQLLGVDNHRVTSDLHKREQKLDGETPKKEMIATLTKRFEGMNEAGVDFFFSIIMSIPDRERWMASTTPERIAELDDIKVQREQEEAKEKERREREAQQIEAARKQQYYFEYARMFNAINSIDMPARYDLCIGEILAIDFVCGGIRRYFPEYAYSVADKYFKYGFVKGMRYAKAQARKKNKLLKPSP